MREIEVSITYSIVSRKVQLHKIVHKLIAPIGACKMQSIKSKVDFNQSKVDFTVDVARQKDSLFWQTTI